MEAGFAFISLLALIKSSLEPKKLFFPQKSFIKIITQNSPAKVNQNFFFESLFRFLNKITKSKPHFKPKGFRSTPKKSLSTTQNHYKIPDKKFHVFPIMAYKFFWLSLKFWSSFPRIDWKKREEHKAIESLCLVKGKYFG